MSDGRDAQPATSVHGAPRPARPLGHELAILALLTVAALALRLWSLGSLPGGPHVDEAWNWIDARRVLEGWRPIFLPDNAGREVLYTYLQATLLTLFGDELAVARGASALAATAMVPLAWAVGRTLAPRELSRSRVGLVCAALAAGSYWSLHFGRFGIRAITFPLFVGGVALLWHKAVAGDPGTPRAGDGVRGGSDHRAGERTPAWRRAAATFVDHRWAVACGVVLGLAVYSHPAGRGLVALPLAHALWLGGLAWWAHRGDKRGVGGARSHGTTATRSPTDVWRALGIAAWVGVVVAAPVIGWWLAHPDYFLGHAGEVSVVGEGPGAVLANAAKVLGMFNLAGDPARWRNLPGRPVFGPLVGLLFLGGLALTLRGAWRGERGPALALAWLGVLLAPTVLADQAPNFSRAIGILPVVYVFPAWALAWLASRILGEYGAGDDRQSGSALTAKRPRWARAAAVALLIVIPLQAAEASARDYFLDWARHPETPIAFDADLAALGRLAGDRWQLGDSAYLSPAMAVHPSLRVSTAVELPGIDAGLGLAFLERGGDGDAPGASSTGELAEGAYLYVDRIDFQGDQPAMAAGWAERPALTADALRLAPFALPERGITGLRARLDPDRLSPPETALRFGPLALIHVALEALTPGPGDEGGARFDLALAWRVAGPTARPWTITTRLVEPGGDSIAQRDGLPLGPTYTTDRWRPGEIVLHRVSLTLEARPAPERADVMIGWYARIPPSASEGRPSSGRDAAIEDQPSTGGRVLERAARDLDLRAGTP